VLLNGRSTRRGASRPGTCAHPDGAMDFPKQRSARLCRRVRASRLRRLPAPSRSDCGRGTLRLTTTVRNIDRITCDGRGMCAALLPEFIDLDDWGYPIVRGAETPPDLMDHARRSVEVCPVLASRLSKTHPRLRRSRLARTHDRSCARSRQGTLIAYAYSA
jgi:ferredoxin